MAPLPGASVSLPVIGSPARVSAVTSSGESAPSLAFSSRDRRRVDAGVCRVAVPRGQLGVVLAGRPARWRRGSRRPAGRAGCRPCRSSTPCRRGAGSWRRPTPRRRSPTEPSSSPGTNHLKPTGTSSSVRPRSAGHPVDHRRRDEGLADRGRRGPARAGPAVEVLDRHGEVVVGVHQAGVGRDDAVPVGVGVVARRDVVGVLARAISEAIADGERAVHPDLAVPVERHERPLRVDARVDDGEVEAVPLADLAPVVRPPRRRAGRRRCAPRPSRIASRSTTLGRSST